MKSESLTNIFLSKFQPQIIWRYPPVWGLVQARCTLINQHSKLRRFLIWANLVFYYRPNQKPMQVPKYDTWQIYLGLWQQKPICSWFVAPMARYGNINYNAMVMIISLFLSLVTKTSLQFTHHHPSCWMVWFYVSF